MGNRKVERWANEIGVKIINMNFDKQDPFFNINTREDLEKAIKMIKHDQLQTIYKDIKKFKNYNW